MDPFIENDDGDTAKDIAEEGGYAEIVELLQRFFIFFFGEILCKIRHEETYEKADESETKVPDTSSSSSSMTPSSVPFVNDEFGRILVACNLKELRPRFDAQGMDCDLVKGLVGEKGEQRVVTQIMRDVRITQTQAEVVVREVMRSVSEETISIQGSNFSLHSRIHLPSLPSSLTSHCFTRGVYTPSSTPITLKTSPYLAGLANEVRAISSLSSSILSDVKFFPTLAEEEVFEEIVKGGEILHGIPLMGERACSMHEYLDQVGGNLEILEKTVLAKNLLQVVNQVHRSHLSLLNLSFTTISRFPTAFPEWKVTGFEYCTPVGEEIPRRFEGEEVSALFCAPEIVKFQRGHGESNSLPASTSMDMWSVGICTLQLLGDIKLYSGMGHFTSNDAREYLISTPQDQVQEDVDRIVEGISRHDDNIREANMVDLLKRMLSMERGLRITASEALKHDLFVMGSTNVRLQQISEMVAHVNENVSTMGQRMERMEDSLLAGFSSVNERMDDLSNQVREGNEAVLSQMKGFSEDLKESLEGALQPLYNELVGPIDMIQAQLESQSLADGERDVLMHQMADKMDELNVKMDSLGEKMDGMSSNIANLDGFIKLSYQDLVTGQSDTKDQLASLQGGLAVQCEELRVMASSSEMNPAAITALMGNMETLMEQQLSSSFTSAIKKEFGDMKECIEESRADQQELRACVQSMAGSVSNMEEGLGELLEKTDQMQSSMSDIQEELKRQSNKLNDLIVGEMDCPAIPLILPDPPKGMTG